VLVTFTDAHPQYRARMKTWENTMPNIFVFDALRTAPQEDTFYPYDGQPNARGYSIIAEDA